jgi:hypothetical protein
MNIFGRPVPRRIRVAMRLGGFLLVSRDCSNERNVTVPSRHWSLIRDPVPPPKGTSEEAPSPPVRGFFNTGINVRKASLEIARNPLRQILQRRTPMSLKRLFIIAPVGGNLDRESRAAEAFALSVLTAGV